MLNITLSDYTPHIESMEIEDLVQVVVEVVGIGEGLIADHDMVVEEEEVVEEIDMEGNNDHIFVNIIITIKQTTNGSNSTIEISKDNKD